jgi:hypothetical protein
MFSVSPVEGMGIPRSLIICSTMFCLYEYTATNPFSAEILKQTGSRMTRYTILDSLVPNQIIMIRTAKNSHTVMLSRQPSNISLVNLCECLSRSKIIRVDCEMSHTTEPISFILSEPPTPSWKVINASAVPINVLHDLTRIDSGLPTNLDQWIFFCTHLSDF